VTMLVISFWRSSFSSGRGSRCIERRISMRVLRAFRACGFAVRLHQCCASSCGPASTPRWPLSRRWPRGVPRRRSGASRPAKSLRWRS